MPAALLLVLLLAEPPVTTFTFPADQGRLNTGLFIDHGERVKVIATGAWSMWAGHFGHSNADGHRFRVGSFGWGRLMGRIGASGEVSIGTNCDWTSSDPGLLVLYPNVGDYGIRGGDGQLEITVTGGRPVEAYLARLARDGVRVTVPATGVTVTDVLVREDDLVQIEAVGEWTMYAGGPILTAQGDPKRLLPDQTPWGRLVARVGGPTFAVADTYVLGVRSTLRPKRAGLLHLYAAVGPYAGHQRSGALEVVIRGVRRAGDEERRQALAEAAAYERSLAFLRVHQYRRSLDLAPAYCDPALMRAAQAHAEALASGGEPGSAPDRVRAAGFAGRLVGEAIHGYTDGIRAVDGFWGAVYQRAMLLEPAGRAVGVGIAAGAKPVCVLLIGEADQPPAFDVTVPPVVQSPKPDQINVPSQVDPRATPSPFDAPPAGPVGYPVSLTVTADELTGVGEALLADARSRKVPCLVLGPGRDPHGRLRQTLFVVPLQPLRPFETYQVAIRYETKAGPQQASWRFTCGLERDSVLPPPRLGVPSNPAIDLG